MTRPAHQADNLCRLITELGGRAIRLPALELVAVNDSSGNQAQWLVNLDKFQWLVFISANAVNFALKANDGKIDLLKSTRIAAIGRATAQALETAGLPADLVPGDGYNSEALLSKLRTRMRPGQRCLIVRGRGGREELARVLRENGVQVEYWEVYERIMPAVDVSEAARLIERNQLEFNTITSGEALKNLLMMFGETYHQALFAVPLIVVSQRIGDVACQLGFKRITVTDNPSDAAVLKALTTIIKTGESGRSE